MNRTHLKTLVNCCNHKQHNEKSSELAATAQDHGRKHSTGPRPEAQTTEMTAGSVRNEENAPTIDRQTSVGDDPDQDDDQHPETSNPLMAPESHVRKLDYT